MRLKKFCLLGIAAIIGANIMIACDSAKETQGQFAFDFNQSDDGFTPIFSDYPNEDRVEEFYEFQSDHVDIPIDDAGKGLFISGNNHSDDLFMGYFKELNGLSPETEYRFTIRFLLATDVEESMVGIGGSPGESVFVKCGVVAEKPKIWLDSLNHFRLNLDKGSQSQSGSDMMVVGNLAKTQNNHPGEYEFNEIQAEVIAKTDKTGAAYLIIGTDSGFEGLSSYYLDDISVMYVKHVA